MMMIQHPVTMTGGQHSPLYGEKKKKLSRIQETAQHHFLHRLVVFRLESHIFFLLSRSIYSSSNVSLLFTLIQII